jgi:hypothetical protein
VNLNAATAPTITKIASTQIQVCLISPNFPLEFASQHHQVNQHEPRISRFEFKLIIIAKPESVLNLRVLLVELSSLGGAAKSDGALNSGRHLQAS